MRRIPFLLASSAAISLTSAAPVLQAQPSGDRAPVAEQTDQEFESIDAFFNAYDQAQLDMSPSAKAYRGIRDDDYGKWTDPSDEAEEARFQLMQDTAARMRATFDMGELSEDEALSYRLYEMMAEREALLHPFSNYAFVFDHRRGAHTSIPAFLINIHRVSELDHAEAYVSRIAAMGPYLDTMTEQARERADAGIMPPDWVYPYVIADIEALLAAGSDNAVLEDFRGKIVAADLGADIARLELQADNAWRNEAVPAYQRLLAEVKRQQAFAPTDDGVWRLADGDKYYAARLKSYTTKDLTADEIHNIGLREVDRIHGEMHAIMEKVGFEGSLQDFFEFARTDDRFFYTSREEYIADARKKIDTLGEKMPEFFGTLPEAPMVIKAVEAFREKSAGKAFYQSPSPDGSRPGTYYVNLYNLRDMSKNELEALAYHEGLPGHHLQRAIQTELGDSMAPFRRFGGVTAYTEGWGLYSEELGKDMGFYQDPYSDFGRLGMELWRACRLVVDTGLHSKRWTREEAIEYLAENTPNPQGDIVNAIERYIVTPGQATAYMIGKLKIMELRSMAMRELGDDFDYRGFHDAVLLSGPVPLDILEENVEKWVNEVKAS
ncbi:DUF885 domain-containing protein [Erythrobacter ani]|uniref:DUF885 domain-containing protein n=1 Tax=Erythrobacter ani TaxID=2827235 RepID=A0ABS6SKM6_9SPHN|nr:DUF885 domain-containing protein [Erythrobacter ani]MBV7265544.1 DUF885 domain-containing protein [Erythrobacter ani]